MIASFTLGINVLTNKVLSLHCAVNGVLQMNLSVGTCTESQIDSIIFNKTVDYNSLVLLFGQFKLVALTAAQLHTTLHKSGAHSCKKVCKSK